MVVLRKFGYVFVIGVLVMSRWFVVSQGVSVYDDNKPLLSEEDKRGGIVESTKGGGFSNEDKQRGKANTAKRGLSPGGGDERHYGDGSRYGDYDSGRYGGTGGGYPHSGISGGGGYAHSGIGGRPGDDRGPPYYEPDGGYPHDGGGYHHDGGGFMGGRPSGYGPPYHGGGYPPPGPPPYHGGGYDDHYHSSGPDQGMGGFKSLSLKKLLIPLAGLAILGVAAAASQNPVLLQLGSVHGRKRRSLALPSDTYPSNPVVKPIKAY